MEFDKRSPIYEQIIQNFKEKIANGSYQPGQEVPSRRELGNQLKINPNTAQRAYKEMEDQGLIYTDGNSPSKITEDTNKIWKVREELINQAIDDFIAAIKPVGLSADVIVELIRNRYEEEKDVRNL